MILATAMIIGCCFRNKEVDSQELILTETVTPTSDSLVEILDSMLAYLYIDAKPASKATYEWEWARRTRITLGKAEVPLDLISLNALSYEVDKVYAPLTASSPSEANEAAGVFASTARFRMVNAYQVLADQFSEMLDEDWFKQDYALWEDVYKEYEETHANAFGRNTSYMLCMAEKTLCELRCTILMQEIGYFDVERDGAAEWYVEADEIRWKSEQKAIRLWYDHRMKMADKLGNTNLAEYLRRMTYKAVFIYLRLQLGWHYDFENL